MKETSDAFLGCLQEERGHGGNLTGDGRKIEEIILSELMQQIGNQAEFGQSTTDLAVVAKSLDRHFRSLDVE